MTYRNRKLLDIAHEAPCFLRLPGCQSGVNPSVPAHSNLLRHGRGIAHRSHDVFAVPSCGPCHYQFDYGHTLSRAEREQIWQRAFEDYQLWLWETGKVRVT